MVYFAMLPNMIFKWILTFFFFQTCSFRNLEIRIIEYKITLVVDTILLMGKLTQKQLRALSK